MEQLELMNIIEALLFASEKPVSLNKLKQVLDEPKPTEIEAAINELQERYKDHAVRIIKVGGGYLLATKPEFHHWVKRMYITRSRPRLSQAALETLSVIAYKQPISRIEIEMIRGVNSDGVLGTLLERNLIAIKGRAETVGRPLLYGTTDEFLHYFGLNDLSELPRPEEIEALLRKSEEEKQKHEKEGDSVQQKDSD